MDLHGSFACDLLDVYARHVALIRGEAHGECSSAARPDVTQITTVSSESTSKVCEAHRHRWIRILLETVTAALGCRDFGADHRVSAHLLWPGAAIVRCGQQHSVATRLGTVASN